MYERFTDKARQSMQLAKREAVRLHHDYVGTEHILLVLIEQGIGILNNQGGNFAVNVLKNLGLNLSVLRSEVTKLAQGWPERIPARSKLPHTPRAKKVIEYAMEEARGLKHDYVGTEHILLGLLREKDGVAAVALQNEGLELDEVREEILGLLAHGMRSPAPPSPHVRPEIEDLPDDLKAAVAELEAEIGRFGAEKEKAVADQDFEKAASLRDDEYKVRRRRGGLLREWLASRPIGRGWLSANDGAVLRLARTISEHRDWKLLPTLANELERSGCTDTELINHCREPRDHSSYCWVVELLLAHA